MDSTSPIGVFDSGLGGLTVLSELLRSFPNENFIYLGDTARLPYGAKSAQTIARYAQQNIAYLKAQGAKAVVVACNSASSALDDMDLSHLPFTLGVIEPSAEMALRLSSDRRLGVIATAATIAAKAYPKALYRLSPDCFVADRSAPLLVPLVEEGWLDDPITSLVIHRYVQPLLTHGIDTLILGCTHYPALRTIFQRVAGSRIRLVESGLAVSEALLRALAQKKFPANETASQPYLRILATDVGSRFSEMAQTLLATEHIPTTELVDITKPQLS